MILMMNDMKPASNPEYSPLLEMRKRHELQKVSVGQLEKMVLDSATKQIKKGLKQKGGDLKQFCLQWLIEDVKNTPADERKTKIELSYTGENRCADGEEGGGKRARTLN